MCVGHLHCTCFMLNVGLDKVDKLKFDESRVDKTSTIIILINSTYYGADASVLVHISTVSAQTTSLAY